MARAWFYKKEKRFRVLESPRSRHPHLIVELTNWKMYRKAPLKAMMTPPRRFTQTRCEPRPKTLMFLLLVLLVLHRARSLQCRSQLSYEL